MAERRSMNEALNMSPEKLAFIKQDPRAEAPIGKVSNTVDVVDMTTRKESPVSAAPEPEPEESEQPIPALRPDRESMKRQAAASALIPLTTRLQQATATALRRAYLERKLEGYANATQQEIVEEALQMWLSSQGYLDSPS